MTVQTILTACQQDLLTTVQGLGSGTTLIDYVDRIHKECLHLGIYAAYNRVVETVPTVVGTTSYTLGTALVAVDALFDRTLSRPLYPFGEIRQQAAQQPATVEVAQGIVKSASPMFYRFIAPTTLIVMPTPQCITSLEVHGRGQVATLTSTTATLIVPDDGLSTVVAGVNALAAAFLRQPQIADFWEKRYLQLRNGEAVPPDADE